VLNRKKRALRSQTTGLGRIGRVLLSVAVGISATLVGTQASHAANTVTVNLPTQKLIVSNNSSVGINGASISDSGGTSQNLLVNITLTNIGASNDYLSIDTSTVSGIAAAYPYSGSTFNNFTLISFTGTLANVNSILGSSRFKFNKGSTAASGVLPSIAITASEMPPSSTIAYNSVNGHYYQYIAYSTTVTVSSSCTTYNSSSTCIKDQTQTEAYKFASAYTFGGKSGYLVSITSASENLFVQNQIGSGVQNVWIGASDHTAFGGEGIWQWMGQNAPEYKLTFGHASPATPCITFTDNTHANNDFSVTSDTCGGTNGLNSYGVWDAGNTYMQYWTNDTTTANGVSTAGYSNWCTGEPNNADSGHGENSAVTNWSGSTRNGSSCWNDLYDTNNGGVAGFVIEYGDANSPGNFSGASSSATVNVFLNPVFSINAGNNQSATVDSQVATVPQVKLVDEAGNVVTGTPTVTWAVTGGGGVLGATTSTINATTGYATPTSWTMGTNKGTDTITATLSDTANPTTLTFVATAIGVKQSPVSISNGSTTAGLTYALSASGGTTATAIVFTTSSANCSISGTTLITSFSTSSYTCLVIATRPGGTHYQDETATATISMAASVNGLSYPTVLTDIAGSTVWGDPSPAASGGTGAITYSISASPGNITNRITINPTTGRVTVNTNALATDQGTYTITATDTLGDTFTTTLPINFVPGCTVTSATSGGITVETVTSGTNCGIVLPNYPTHFLVVGGGGQGGSGRGGGGGAGGLVYNTFTPQAGSVYTVTVGTGGQANSGQRGASGTESYVSLNNNKIIVAGGGGGGGGLNTDTTNIGNGADAPSLSATPSFSARGSGGGAGTNFSNPTIYYSAGGAGFKSGGSSYKCTSNYVTNDHMRTNGGGGGAGANGSGGGTNCATQNLSNVSAPNGGAGLAYAISGVNTYYAGGGGGSDGRADGLSECQNYYSTLKGTGGSGVGGNGAQYCVVYDTSTTSGLTYVAETAAAANTGSGGGATIRSFTTSGYVGYGADGIALFRFINQAPVILGVNCDTRTALFSSNTLTTTATLPETLTATMDTSSVTLLNRVYQWQYRTSSASNTWINIGYNSPVETFTAGTGVFLNGAQIRLAVTDSDTVDTSTDTLNLTSYSSIITLTINAATTFTTAKQNVSYTYGSGTNTVLTRTTSGGTAPLVINTAYSATPNSGALIQDTSTVSGTLYETVTSRAFNYGSTGVTYETITVADAVGYVFTETLTITVTKAGTLTFQADALTSLTYSLDSVTVRATTSTTGLVANDTYTVGSYIFQPLGSRSCSQGGYCNIGDTGPAGGIVFADLTANNVELAQTGITSGGRYLEAAPVDLTGTYVYCSGPATLGSENNASSPGFGSYGTYWLVQDGCTGGAAVSAANYSVNGFSDWFLADRDEMTAMTATSALRTAIGINAARTYWTTTRYSIVPSRAIAFSGADGSYTDYDSTTAFYARAIRTFNPTSDLMLIGSPTTTPPTNAGTYQITIDSTTVSFQSGNINNYATRVYNTGQVTINKASHKYLLANESVTALTWPYGSSITLTAFSDRGETTTATFAKTNGTGSTCTLTTIDSKTATLSATSTNQTAAICYITLSRPATANFNAITGATITIAFTLFTVNSANPYYAGGGNMAIGIGGPSTYVASDTASVISAIYDNTTSSSSVFHAGDSITLTGTYLDGVTQIKFIGGGTTVTFSANSSPTTLTFTLPGDVVSGPVLVQKPALDGRGYKSGRFNITIT
jgi:hypothetical protein